MAFEPRPAYGSAFSTANSVDDRLDALLLLLLLPAPAAPAAARAPPVRLLPPLPLLALVA